MSRDSSYALKLGHHELGEARMELETTRRLAQELLRDTVELTKQRDELLAACEALEQRMRAGQLLPWNCTEMANARAAIANAKAVGK